MGHRLPRGQLLWSDEFSGPSLDDSKWKAEPTASMSPPLNDELQRYLDGSTNSTAAIVNGALVLTARRDDHGGIVSARLSTFQRFHFTYGIVEARMRGSVPRVPNPTCVSNALSCSLAHLCCARLPIPMAY